MSNALYDKTSPRSILTHARRLLGKSLHALYPSATPLNAGKGGLGQCVEVYHFGYDINGVSEADFWLRERGASDIGVSLLPWSSSRGKRNKAAWFNQTTSVRLRWRPARPDQTGPEEVRLRWQKKGPHCWGPGCKVAEE